MELRNLRWTIALRIVVVAVGLTGGTLSSQLINTLYGWTNYVSSNAIVEIAQRGEHLYVATEGGMFKANMQSRATRVFTTVEGLSSLNTTTIYTDEPSGLIFLGFSDGRINVIDANDEINYVTDIARTELFTTKAINRFASQDGLLYVATEFGIVVYDIALDETRFSVTKISENSTGTPVKDIAIGQGRLWAALSNQGLYSVDLNDPNITVPSAWRLESGSNGLSAGGVNFVCQANDIVYATRGDTILQKVNGLDWTYGPFPFEEYTYLNAHGGDVFATAGIWTYTYLEDGTFKGYKNFSVPRAAYVTGDTLWCGDKVFGMMYFKEDSSLNFLFPQGPFNNFITEIGAGNGEFYIAPRGKRGSSDRWYDQSGIPYFSFLGGGWNPNSFLTGELSTSAVWRDFARAYYDQRTGLCYMGSFAEGIVVMKDGDPVEYFNADNSGLLETGDRNRVSGLSTDQFGNLWVTQIVNDFPIHVRTPEGAWYRMNPTNMSPIGLIIDDYDNKWIVNQGQGLVVYHDNFTPEDPSDDRVKKLTTEIGRGGLLDNSVYTVAQDRDQQIWIGTESGVTIYYDPSIIWTDQIQDAACPLIDGFCLLRDQRVNDIEVDAANRKWLATENGAYLVNEDGTEVIYHFTTENSPLFDNDVKTLAVDQSTGEVLFGTAKGLVGFIGDAIQGRPEMVDSLYAFPNPVQEDFSGRVMIKNTDQNSRIKITTPNGQLVRELDSNGGEIPWDLTDTYGKRVPPGIYVILVATADGESAGVTKLAVIERPF